MSNQIDVNADGDTTEDHASAVIFNMFGYMHEDGVTIEVNETERLV